MTLTKAYHQSEQKQPPPDSNTDLEAEVSDLLTQINTIDKAAAFVRLAARLATVPQQPNRFFKS